MNKKCTLLLIAFAFAGLIDGFAQTTTLPNKEISTSPGLEKIKDLIIYKDSLFYSSFPSVVKRPDGEILVAFRRAPDRRLFGEQGISHTDPNSYLVMVRSKNGETWTQNPELIFANPFGGSQDPCLLQLKDGTLICASYTWTAIRSDADSLLHRNISVVKTNKKYATAFAFLGGYILRSVDGAHRWSEPIYPPEVPGDLRQDVWGNPLPAYNRGAICEGKNGKLYWAVATKDPDAASKTSVHLMVSENKGLDWKYESPIAKDPTIEFNETSMYETPKGDLLAFIRTESGNQQSYISRSTNGGKSFQLENMGFYGYPLHALRLPDNRVLLTYGYRHVPYGIRARILNAECTDYATAPEFIIREDGSASDLGYSWSVMLDKNRVLVVYYFNNKGGIRYIACTILKLKK